MRSFQRGRCGVLFVLLDHTLEIQALDAHVVANGRKLVSMRPLREWSHPQVDFCDEPTANPFRCHPKHHPWQEHLHKPEGWSELNVLLGNDAREDDALLEQLPGNPFLEREDVPFTHAPP